jgi:hypothetical protein
MLKAIDTKFEGYLFRSRLEARWAVFFSEIGLRYEYEKEGFKLEDGSWYLPDFYLPSIHSWLEVKPDSFSETERSRVILLSKGFGEDVFVILGNGMPGPRQYDCYCNGEQVSDCTLSSYIKTKDWAMPYFGEGWTELDYSAFNKAKTARFEHFKIRTHYD